MSATTTRAQLVAAFAAIYLLWGGTSLAIALGLQSIPPFLLIGSRSILGGMVLFAFSQRRGLALRPWRGLGLSPLSRGPLFFRGHAGLGSAPRFVSSPLSGITLAAPAFSISPVRTATPLRAR